MKIDKWKLKDTKGVKIEERNQKVIITNDSDNTSKIYSTQLIRCKNEFINVEFKCNVINGAGTLLKLINRHKQCKMDVILNSKTSSVEKMKGFLLPIIEIKPHTKIEIKKVEITKTQQPLNTYNNFLGKKKVLLITPSYPSPDNLYMCGFVHARVKEYLKAGIDIEVVCAYYYNEMSYYEIEGVNVYKTPYKQLRSILMSKKYDAILVHFLDEEYSNYLDTSYIKDTPIFIWNHGADILYWNYKQFETPYFTNEYELPKVQEKRYKKRDIYIKEFAKRENFHWIFVSQSEKNEAEKIHGKIFKNAIIIPNIINSDIFAYKEKGRELRKKIFMTRKFDNTKKYAIDIVILTILELSRRKYFNDLEFYLCGEGNYHEELVAPVRNFPNVHIVNNFLTHKQIKEYHDKCGIALFPTRQDTQGVSALEAASSGLAVITSDIEVIHEYFDESLNTICPVEDFHAYADVIERLYYNPEEFQKISRQMHKVTQDKCDKQNTINKEIEYISKNVLEPSQIINHFTEIADKPILTVAIPSYNAEKFLDKCLQSLLKSKYACLTEILVINDGSKDNTSSIGKMYEELTTVKGKSIVKIINKENGGHGSGINKGIEIARGKYFKVVDADDWLDEKEYDKLLEKLVTEDADLILTDYCEARSYEDKPFKVEYYNNLEPDVIYNLDDVITGAYGFKDWGPTLPTSTYKTDCLRKANFKLLEKTFYVDMTYNAYSIMYINTVKRYNLNIYRYYIGNIGQSVSQEGMMKNYKHHENVILELARIVYKDDRLSDNKREYVLKKLLLPMIHVQLYINLDLFHSIKKFRIFEKRIKEYPELFSYHEFNIPHIKFHRYTKGIFVGVNPFLRRQMDRARRIIHKLKEIAKKIIRKILRRRGEY